MITPEIKHHIIDRGEYETPDILKNVLKQINVNFIEESHINYIRIRFQRFQDNYVFEYHPNGQIEIYCFKFT